MALQYVSLEEAKNQLRVRHCQDDDHIDLLIGYASNACKNYLKDFSAYEAKRNSDDDYLLDSNDEPIIQLDNNDARVVKAEVKMAVLYLISLAFNDRNGELQAQLAAGELPTAAKNILYPLRDPACQ